MKASHLWIGGGLLLLLAVGGALALLSGRAQEESWSIRSPRAAEEFELALENWRKISYPQAAAHLERALELDPDLVIARFYLHFFRRGKELDKLKQELLAVDLEPLKTKERFLLSYYRARWQKDDAEADAILDRYLGERPEDPDALSIRCSLAWQREELARAEACYRQLVTLHPNWVLAQNRLGYLTMSQERFAESEERFRTYRYIAPELPDPHDSLADLLILRGRYDEAEASLERALELQPSYCDSYLHLAILGLFSGRHALVPEAMRELGEQEECGVYLERGFGCWFAASVLNQQGKLEEAWALARDRCLPRYGVDESLAFRLALANGAGEDIRPHVEKLRRRLQIAGPRGRERIQAMLLNQEALELLWQGRAEGAAAKLRQADGLLAFNGVQEGYLKLEVRLALGRALEMAGKRAEAEEVLAAIDRVNPQFADTVGLPELAGLGTQGREALKPESREFGN